jgi:L-rhamnose-H+ transport protein
MLILPFLVAAFVAPNWQAAVHAAGARTVWAGAAYGFGWGIGAILFGYGITLAGLSVGSATIFGVSTAVGSILPFLVKSPADLFTAGGLVILLGIAGCLMGVVVCGRAGVLREQQVVGGGPPRKFGRTLVVCLASGVLSACANLGFAFASRVGDEAQRLGLNPVFSTLTSWMPVFWGATVSLLLWFVGLQIKRGTWRKNFGPGAAYDWMNGALMGAIWFVAMIPYGMGAYYLGRLGTTVGWAMYTASTLIVANVLGFITHEWTGAPTRAVRMLYVGLGILVAAIVVLAIGSSMTSF